MTGNESNPDPAGAFVKVEPLPNTDLVSGVAVTADGKRAVSVSYDNTLKVWDLESGAPLATFSCDGASYSCALAIPYWVREEDNVLENDTLTKFPSLS